MKTPVISLLLSEIVSALAAPSVLQAGSFTDQGSATIPHRYARSRLPTIENYGRARTNLRPRLDRSVQYSANWAGAVKISQNITEVSSTVIAPNVSLPTDGVSSAQYGGSAWVGIDGYTCRQAIFQTGIDWAISDGQTRYSAWYEWYPEYSFSFNISVNPGDRISLHAVAQNATTGTAYVINESAGTSACHSFVGQMPLCGENAEWIVEDYELSSPQGTELVPFAAFDAISFRNATVTVAGEERGVKNSTILAMKQGSNIVAQCKPVGKHAVDCSYS